MDESIVPATVHDHEYSIKVHLLDEIDRHLSHRHRFLQRLVPRFDLEELQSSYVLIGELPGVQGKDVTITATDNHNLEIGGCTMRVVTEESAPKGGRIEAESEYGPRADTLSPMTRMEASDGAATSGEQADHKETLALKPKPLLSERVLGEFHRSFSFSKPIEPKLVTASMQDGLLKVKVPKGPAPKQREVPIDTMNIVYAGF